MQKGTNNKGETPDDIKNPKLTPQEKTYIESLIIQGKSTNEIHLSLLDHSDRLKRVEQKVLSQILNGTIAGLRRGLQSAANARAGGSRLGAEKQEAELIKRMRNNAYDIEQVKSKIINKLGKNVNKLTARDLKDLTTAQDIALNFIKQHQKDKGRSYGDLDTEQITELLSGLSVEIKREIQSITITKGEKANV